MDFTSKLDGLQQHVASAKSAAQSAVTESRDKLEQRIDQAQVDLDLAGMDAKQRADEGTARARSKWAAWAIDNARLAMLSAINARAYANERAAVAKA